MRFLFFSKTLLSAKKKRHSNNAAFYADLYGSAKNNEGHLIMRSLRNFKIRYLKKLYTHNFKRNFKIKS